MQDYKLLSLIRKASLKNIDIFDSMIHLGLLKKYGEKYIELFELIRELINFYDPVQLAFVSLNEHNPEIKNIAKGVLSLKRHSNTNIYKIIKDVFDKNFCKSQKNNTIYFDIAQILSFKLFQSNKYLILNIHTKKEFKNSVVIQLDTLKKTPINYQVL